MLQTRTFPLIEKVILGAALNVMFQTDFEAVTIQNIAERTQIDVAKILKLYSNDNELRMTAMEFAALNWGEHVRDLLREESTTQDKLKKLIQLFIGGTASHPNSLSLYLDIWKKIRDSGEEDAAYLKEKLFDIYEFYAALFKEVLANNNIAAIFDDPLIDQLAWIMVVISDGFHIQTLVQGKVANFESIGNTMYRMVRPLLSEKDELK